MNMQSVSSMSRSRLKVAVGAFVLLLCAGGAALAIHGRPALVLRNWRESRKAELEKQRMASWPRVMLWAWERPEDFTANSGGDYGVAFLAKTIYLSAKTNAEGPAGGGSVRVGPRMQPLAVSPGTALMAVVRIETPAGYRSAAYSGGEKEASEYSDEVARRVAEEIVSAASLPRVTAVQIDFDAAGSEHEFYRRLLVETRKRLPNETRVSITALSSWCLGDRWLEELPDGTIDEAVPMLFRMGPGGAEVARWLKRDEEFPIAACRNSVGVSTDEPLSRDILADKFRRDFRGGKRTYVFSPRSWTAEMLSQTVPVVSSSSTE